MLTQIQCVMPIEYAGVTIHAVYLLTRDNGESVWKNTNNYLLSSPRRNKYKDLPILNENCVIPGTNIRPLSIIPFKIEHLSQFVWEN